MMRFTSLAWFVMAAFVGVMLFHTSQDVQQIGKDLKSLNQEILREEDAMQMLKAEWGYLNQPARLEALAGRYAEIEPASGAQLDGMKNLPTRAERFAHIPVPEHKPQLVSLQGEK